MRSGVLLVMVGLLGAGLAGCKGSGTVVDSSNQSRPGGRANVPQTPGSPMPSNPSMPGVALTVVADDPALLDGPGQQVFKIGTTRELLVRLTVPSAPATTIWMTLELFTPQGALFVDKHAPFSSDASVKLVPNPANTDLTVDVTQMKAVASGIGLDSYFLVGGTALQNQGSGGAWTVRARLDGYPGLGADAVVDFGMSL